MVERAPERLEDRALAGLLARGALEHDRRLRVVPPLDQRLATLEQRVGTLALAIGLVVVGLVVVGLVEVGIDRTEVRVAPVAVGSGLLSIRVRHASMVARIVPLGDAPEVNPRASPRA
jgi:hypothetical protein